MPTMKNGSNYHDEMSHLKGVLEQIKERDGDSPSIFIVEKGSKYQKIVDQYSDKVVYFYSSTREGKDKPK